MSANDESRGARCLHILLSHCLKKAGRRWRKEIRPKMPLVPVMIKKRQKTLAAACVSYAVESVVNTLAPLLFVTFREQLGVSLAQLSILITLNFFTQILVDISSTFYIRKLGYRRCVLLADMCALCGLLMMGVLPRFLTAKFAGLVCYTDLSCG